ncbi:MAG: class I SAM-dependent methyltransferase family protein [Candidatus Thermoplasmatota archaeon]|nr:class I SAM-dependent methyltransferase family protein [Candidatus Thermoplasmatota archaeon]
MEKEPVPCLIVPRERVEEARKKLSQENLLDTRHKMEMSSDGLVGYIPVLGQPPCGIYPVEEHQCAIVASRAKSYKDLLDLPADVLSILPSAFDVVGELAVIRLPEEALAHSRVVGEAMLRFLPSIKTALLDKGVEGEYRIRSLEHMAGVETTRTVHKEYGVEMCVDLARAYFSPRLATEHWRVAEMVQPGEKVLDMFTGVGPFPLVIAKHRKPYNILAVDINPHAIELLQESMVLNKLGGIEAVVGDARKIAGTTRAHRIIMNLPHGAKDFLDAAVEALEPGGTIHYHEILEETKMNETIGHLRRRGLEITSSRVVRTYAPGQLHYVFDLLLAE